MYLVGQHGPLLSADGTTKHAEVDVVGHVGPRHLPLHDDGLLFRARRCLHLADVAASRQVAGLDVAVEIAVHIGGLYAVVHHVAHRAFGIEACRRFIRVDHHAVVQHAPGILARRRVLDGPVLTRWLYAVFPDEAHGSVVTAVLIQCDGHFELGAHLLLYPEVGNEPSLRRQHAAGQLVFVLV